MDTVTKRSPVLAVMSTLAGLQVITAGSVLTDIVGPKAAALLALLIAGAQIGVQFYVNGQVTPSAAVVAQRNDDGVVVAGPSAQAPTGVVVEEPAPVDAGAGELRVILLFAAAGLLALVAYHLIAPHL